MSDMCLMCALSATDLSADERVTDLAQAMLKAAGKQEPVVFLQAAIIVLELAVFVAEGTISDLNVHLEEKNS